MKITILNQVIEIKNSTGFIPFPYYDVNHSSTAIFVSNHINLVENVDLQLLNTIILKGAIDLLSYKYGNLNNKDNIILNWLSSKVNLTKDLYVIEEEKKKRIFK